MSINYNYPAQAQAAMRWAAAATCERDRQEWARIALAWHDLATRYGALPGIDDMSPGLFVRIDEGSREHLRSAGRFPANMG